MKKKYKIKCKNCGDILEEEIPVWPQVNCSCGNIGLYSDYIAFGMVNHKPAEECYERLDKKLTTEEVEKYLKEIEK